MYCGDALCVLRGTDGGQQRRDAGADVLTEDDRERHIERDAARQCEGLQDTEGRRGALDDRGDDGTDEERDDRVIEHQDDLFELRHIGERLDGIAHEVHAEHQNGKADADRADVLLLVALDEHDQNDANQRNDRGEVGRLQELNEYIFTRNAGHTEDPGGRCGANIRAHDDADGLAEAHDAGVNETDEHDRHGRGGLDRDRDAHAEQQRLEAVGGHGAEHGLELAADHLFKTRGEHVHAVQEEGKTAEQSDDRKYVHK